MKRHKFSPQKLNSQDGDLQGRVCGCVGCEGAGLGWGLGVFPSAGSDGVFSCFLELAFISKSVPRFSAAGHDKGKGFRDGFLCVSVNSSLVKLD